MSAPSSPSSDTTISDLPNALAQSLLAVSHHPDCPTSANFFDNIPKENQPRRLNFMPDRPLILVFPAEIDNEGKYSRNSRYFNNVPSLMFQMSGKPTQFSNYVF